MYRHIHNKQSEQALTLFQLKTHINQFIGILGQIKKQIDFKYHKYTKEHLVRELWGYVFSSPLLSFDSIWEFDNDGTLKIRDVNIVQKQISGISSSEHLLLSVFLQQYNDTLNKVLHSFEDIPALVNLDPGNKDKLVNIINFFEYHPLFFCGEVLLDTPVTI